MRILIAISLLLSAAFALPKGDLDIPFSIENRIAKGDPAQRAQFPFQVYILTSEGNESGDGEGEYDYMCGGSLISDQIVVTAAHCIEDGVSSKIFLGATDLSVDEPGRIIIKVSKENYIIHENYDTNGDANDIALVKLPKKVKFNKYIQVVNLPRRSQKDESFINTMGWISGWGRLGDYKNGTQHLQFACRLIMPNEHCENVFNDYQKETQVCIDGSNGKSPCGGDSGGPLTIVEKDGSKTLVGVTAYGGPECEKGYPAVYTRVTAYLDWIAEKGRIAIRE